MKFAIAFFTTVIMSAWCGYVAAVPLPFTLTIEGGTEQDRVTAVIEDVEGEIDQEGRFGAQGVTSNAAWEVDWDVVGKLDPTVNLAVAVSNLMGVTQTFDFTATLPVAPIGPSSLTAGSVAGSLTDVSVGGATVATTAGTALYTALIDGAPFMSLHPDPTSVSAGTFLSAAVPPADFGTPVPPGPSLPGPAVTTDIGVRLRFTLSPGDTASFTSVFVVEPVPEPSTVVLAGLALCGLVLVVRSSKR